MNVGNVSDELDAGTVGGEIPCEKFGHVCRSHRVGLGCDPEWSWPAGHEARLTLHLAHQLGGTLCLLGGQVRVDPAIPLSALRLLRIVSDPRQKCFPAGRRRRWGARAPVVETRRRHVQPAAHFHHRVAVVGLHFLGVNEFVRVHYRCSLAK